VVKAVGRVLSRAARQQLVQTQAAVVKAREFGCRYAPQNTSPIKLQASTFRLTVSFGGVGSIV
jgi:hypothetical protein